GKLMDAEWPAIADRIAPRAMETIMPFMSAHYVYALARAGRHGVLEGALASVRARSEANDEEGRRVWAAVGRSVVEAAAAFGSARAAAAAALAEPVMRLTPGRGGGDARDVLFRPLSPRSRQAAPRPADAAAFSERKTAGKSRTPLDRALAN